MLLKEGETVTVSVKELYKAFGNTLTYEKIDTDDEECGYYDIMASDGKTLCMDGESCKVLSISPGKIEFANLNGDSETRFSLTPEETALCLFS